MVPSCLRSATARRRVLGTTFVLVAMLLAWAPSGPGFARQDAPPESPEATPEPPAASSETQPSERSPVVRRGDRVSIFGDPIHIPADVYQVGSVVAIGADVVIEGEVRDDVVVISGNLRMTGSARRSVVGILSRVELDGAEVGDQLVNVAGNLEKHDSDIHGQIVNIGFGGWLPDLPSSFGILGFIIFWGRLFKLLVTFVVILLLVALVPDRVRAISEAAPPRFAAAFFVGLLGYLGVMILVAVVGLTVIGLPVVIVIFLVLKWLGIVGIFHAVGSRIGRSFGRELSLLGAVLIVFLPYALIVQLPLLFGLVGLIASGMIGLFLWLFLEVPAVGLVLLTRAGGPPRVTTVAAPAPQPAVAPPGPPQAPPPTVAPPPAPKTEASGSGVDTPPDGGGED